MISNLLTEIAGKASLRYQMFTDSLRAIYQEALHDETLSDQQLAGRANTIALNFLEDERVSMFDDIYEIARIARTATLDEIVSNDTENLSDEALEHLSASQSYLQDELLAQASRDIATLRRSVQRVRLETSLAARASGRSRRAALIEFLVGNKAELGFYFHDKASRKWESKTFVRSIWRQTLLSTYNEIVLFTLADHGIDRAVVEHHSEKADHDGMIIALSSSTEYPTYSEIRDTVFHPNANAWLRKENIDVSA